MPIVSREDFSTNLEFESLTNERFCLVTSLCALTNLQVLNRPADDLVRETIRVRQTFDYVESPTLDSVHISFFLFACFFGLNIHNTAWFYLREAITFAQLIGLDSEESYSHLTNEEEVAYRRRTFWVLFVTERAYAIQRHHSLSMQPSIDVPSSENSCLQEDMKGFNYMVDLWSQIDSNFLSWWNDKRQPITPDWMNGLHYRLCHCLPENLNISEVQEADILISQQWLRTILWQLSTSRMLLSSNSEHEALKFSFPIKISHDLLQITSRVSEETLEVHGIGICEKVFEVASTLVDVMVCDPAMQDNQLAQTADRNLHALLNLLARLRNGKSHWHAIILEKIKVSMPRFIASATPERETSKAPSSLSREDSWRNDSLSQSSSPRSLPSHTHLSTNQGSRSPSGSSPQTWVRYSQVGDVQQLQRRESPFSPDIRLPLYHGALDT
ncbi:protein of unknown function [Taphrina deformans PYCC 5710]|uniref:Xylanolytic transcriptional activator regulatory domain-containing protein n=1 Tax=Taphrina deformans (strain PYCC 5710 / ATCC 11124 / CBS 356.35 / IMI 108563 / JCM 9778 / NBRC 8474) TaxID=1097556 RepID=R4XGK8_TAPDE|nr:protein of unknown function [Taphrina deformans PYCC 5710]|eukprot:CCG84787.1 protein of unknown function [Taphrina deformans PYCC 5710]